MFGCNNMYEFDIKFGTVIGGLSVGAETEEEATQKLLNIIGNRLATAFPELDVEYDVECVAAWDNGDPDEAYDLELDKELGVL